MSFASTVMVEWENKIQREEKDITAMVHSSNATTSNSILGSQLDTRSSSAWSAASQDTLVESRVKIRAVSMTNW